MSEVEEQVLMAPWVGPMSCKNVLSVAVLSMNADIIERISEALNETHSKGGFRWKLRILRSRQLEEIVKQSNLTGRVAIDFVVLALDTSKIMCLDWARKVLGEVHSDLRSRRVVLVNASGLSTDQMAVCLEDLLNIQKETKLDMLNADVSKPEDSKGLARRLLKYMEVSIGVNTGIPNLHIS